MSVCPACGGDGVCRDGFHINPGYALANLLAEQICEECGGDFFTPGDCQICDGTGEVEDDEDDE